MFPHFTQAAARTFWSRNLAYERGAGIGGFAFMFFGTIPTWALGLYRPISLANGVVAAIVLVWSIALYEWARHTIWSRRFGVGWGEHVPEEICERGPYRFVRHPIYLAYMLAWAAVAIALPHWLSTLMLIGNVALFTHAALTDEKTIAGSPLATAYAAYRRRAGMFWPKPGAPSRAQSNSW